MKLWGLRLQQKTAGFGSQLNTRRTHTTHAGANQRTETPPTATPTQLHARRCKPTNGDTTYRDANTIAPRDTSLCGHTDETW